MFPFDFLTIPKFLNFDLSQQRNWRTSSGADFRNSATPGIRRNQYCSHLYFFEKDSLIKCKDLVKQRERKEKYLAGHLSARVLSESIWYLQKFDDEAIEDTRRNFEKLIIDEKAAAPPTRHCGRIPKQKYGGCNSDSKDTVQSMNSTAHLADKFRNTCRMDIDVMADSNERSCGQRGFINDKIKREDDLLIRQSQYENQVAYCPLSDVVPVKHFSEARKTLHETNDLLIAQPVKDICEVLKLLKIREKTAAIPVERPRLKSDDTSRKKRTLGMIGEPEALMEASMYNVNKIFRKRSSSHSPTPSVKARDSKYKIQGSTTPIKKKSLRNKKKVKAEMCETNDKTSDSLNQGKNKCMLSKLSSRSVKGHSALKEDLLKKEKKKRKRLLRKMALREMRAILHESKDNEGNCAKCKSTRKRVSKKIKKITSSLSTKATNCNEKEQKPLDTRARRKQVDTAALNVGLLHLFESNSKE
uniref:Uncharacterized protein n=1 Tax=Glossina austeni TaxID=7395 RepID=A0A1A9VSU1_GLOAU